MEDFVPFKLAKKLKEKGFREKCFAYYSSYGGILYYNEIKDAVPSRVLNVKDFGKCYNAFIDNNIDAPTISQVLKWLRKKHATHIEISLGRNGWYFEIIQYEYYEEEKEYGCKLITIFVIYDSYEEAAIAGIEYVLNKLI